MANKVHWDPDSEGRVMRKGVRALTEIDGEHVTVGVTRFEPGHDLKPHKHPSEQFVCILAGTLEFHVEDEVTVLRKGDILHIPANREHWGIVVGDEPVINLDAWYPHRVAGA